MNNRIYEIKNFSLDNDELMLQETIFHNANGYIGVRANFEEGYKQGCDSIRGSYINGFYDFSEMKQAEKLYGFVEEKQTMLNVADTQSIRLLIDDEAFSIFDGEILSSRRYLDMEMGITCREIHWRSPKGKELQISIKRMTSFEQLSLFTIEYEVTSVNFSGNITFLSDHEGLVQNYCNPDDPRVAGESFCYLNPSAPIIEDGASFITATTVKSKLLVCTGVKNILSKAPTSEDFSSCDTNVTHTLTTSLTNGETVSLIKYSVFADSIRVPNCEAVAKTDLQAAISKPLSHWYEAQKTYLDKFWEDSLLEIEGDDELSIAVCYNLYQLIQSAGKDPHSNIAAKGLSGEGYEGHYFWDTEMYMLPFFTLTNPKIARNLIAYRHFILEYAREHAKILGHQKGALYPWRTIMGKECSGYFPSGSAQYHINGDVAYSVVAYYLATGDLSFIAEKGAEIIFETARLWMDVGNYVDEKFYINDVTGPDEYTCMVNNNYYTNAGAQWNLLWAGKFYNLLKDAGLLNSIAEQLSLTQKEVDSFVKAGENMYLPYDEKLGINPQDDSFLQKPIMDFASLPQEKFPLLLHYHPLYLYRHQVCKQADTVLSHFIFEDAQPLSVMEKSFAYYEKVTTHDSSLSTCIYSIVASKLGLQDKAYHYFGDSAKLDLFNTHHNTKDGIHTANMGGNYMAVVYGFAGLRLKESGIYFAPTLPKQWKSYRFNLLFLGSRIEVIIDSQKATFTLLNGEPQTIHIFGKEVTLDSNITVALNQ